MLPKDRVAAAFCHEPTDRIPIYQAGFSSCVASYVLGREAYVGGGIQQFREAQALWEGGGAHQDFLERSFGDSAELCEKLELDMVRTIYWRKPETPSQRIDQHTFLYGDRARLGAWEIWRFDPPTETYGAVAHRRRASLSPDDLLRQACQAQEAAADYSPEPATFEEHRRALRHFAGQRSLPGTGVGISVPRDREWLEATALYPEIVDKYLDAATTRAQKNVPVMVQLGLLYLFGGGDFAGKAGPFYSPAFFRRHMLPRLTVISETCRQHGAYHLFASDGDLWPVAEDLFGASGVHGFYEIDRNFMPLQRLRQRFPHLTLLGGLRSELLHTGDEMDVRTEARTALEDAREIGGCIIGCSNQIVAGTPESNFWAMMEVLHAQE